MRPSDGRIHAVFIYPADSDAMSYAEDERVILHDEHSEFDGEVGTVTQVMETMFGDETYTVNFEEGQESGVPEDSLEATED